MNFQMKNENQGLRVDSQSLAAHNQEAQLQIEQLGVKIQVIDSTWEL